MAIPLSAILPCAIMTSIMGVLNIVDERGVIIGRDTRKNIHKKGLLHREVQVCFYTPQREILFQLRGKNKDTFPNLLDAIVGGHVELDSDFIDTTLKEIFEETGIRAKKEDLHHITTLRKRDEDPVTDMINNVIREIYAYEFKGKISDLKVEDDEAQGFEAWPVSRLLKVMPDDEKKRFVPSLLGEEYIDIYKKIGNLPTSKS